MGDIEITLYFNLIKEYSKEITCLFNLLISLWTKHSISAPEKSITNNKTIKVLNVHRTANGGEDHKGSSFQKRIMKTGLKMTATDKGLQ